MPAATPPIVAPSLLSADFARLAHDVGILDPERDWLHCDVMDHQFVPNLTFGPLVVEAARRATRAYLDVHLMVVEPIRMVGAFRDAGADGITVHVEACADVAATLAAIRASGGRVGLSLKPGTSSASVEPYLDAIDLLLVMTVEPGFGGQAFMDTMLAKVRSARAARERMGLGFAIEVDGGIAPGTARRAREAGADVFVAGHAIFRQRDPHAALVALRDEVMVAVPEKR